MFLTVHYMHGRSQGPVRVGSCPGLVSTTRPITPSFASLNNLLTCNSVRHKAKNRSHRNLRLPAAVSLDLRLTVCATVSPDLHLAAAYSQRTGAPRRRRRRAASAPHTRVGDTPFCSAPSLRYFLEYNSNILCNTH
jgi:hypothetical protein